MSNILREKIATIIEEECWAKDGNGNCHDEIMEAAVAASRILALPEIAEALIAHYGVENATITNCHVTKVR